MAGINGVTSAVVAAMMARAIEVVVYQAYFEEGSARRVSQVLELENPGVVIDSGGGVRYRYRTLVEWTERTGHWAYPQRPSPRLLHAIERHGLPWPAISLAAPDERSH